jgi:hypothetical protein
MHAVASVEDHVSIEALPLAIVLGLSLKLTVGTAGVTDKGAVTVTVTVCVADPWPPLQVNSYFVESKSAPVDQVPLVAIEPLQPPEAMHASPWREFQVSIELLPLVIVVGVAVKVTDAAPPASIIERVVESPDCAPLGLSATESAGSVLMLS